MSADDKATVAIDACIRKLSKLSKGEVRQEWIDYFVGVLVVLREEPPRVRSRPGRPQKWDSKFYRSVIQKTEEAKTALRAAGKRATDKAALEHIIRDNLAEEGVSVGASVLRLVVTRFQKHLSRARKKSEN